MGEGLSHCLGPKYLSANKLATNAEPRTPFLTGAQFPILVRTCLFPAVFSTMTCAFCLTLIFGMKELFVFSITSPRARHADRTGPQSSRSPARRAI
jgi:hypothetical protein